jgi:hypothetical protein
MRWLCGAETAGVSGAALRMAKDAASSVPLTDADVRRRPRAPGEWCTDVLLLHD